MRTRSPTTMSFLSFFRIAALPSITHAHERQRRQISEYRIQTSDNTLNSEFCILTSDVSAVLPILVDQMKLGLSAQRPANLPILGDDRVLFLRRPHPLASPLRHGRRRLQLD